MRGLGGITLLNTYGPTEAAVTATALDCSHYSNDEMPAQVSIGAPLAARNIYLLGPDLVPVPPGVAGELCIGGDLLARGYLNRPGLTSERFIADPFNEKGGRLYRTGDLARWRADGQIEYLGRMDHQVKIRGFRIELGEIEAQLLLQREIREAIVIAQEGPSGARLVAYVAPHPGSRADVGALREALGRALPDYMVPSTIVVLESLPLNRTAKWTARRCPSLILSVPATTRRRKAKWKKPLHRPGVKYWVLLRSDATIISSSWGAFAGRTAGSAEAATGSVCSLPLRLYFENPLLKDIAAAVHERRPLSEQNGEYDELSGMVELLDLMES